jgi:hypothetical protein
VFAYHLHAYHAFEELINPEEIPKTYNGDIVIVIVRLVVVVVEDHHMLRWTPTIFEEGKGSTGVSYECDTLWILFRP